MAQTQAQFFAANPGATASDYSAYWIANNPNKVQNLIGQSGIGAKLSSITNDVAAARAALGGGTTNVTGQKPEERKVVTVITRRKTGGVVQQVQIWSDGSETIIDEYKDQSAREAAMQMFENLGLGDEFLNSMMASIDAVYANSVAPTDSEVLNAIYNSDAYKKRFKANEVIKQRIASGKGLPGDKLLSPAEYIGLEKTYREYMQSAGLPTGFYDTPEDFTNFISNSIAPTEVKARVDIAADALQKADANTVNALKQYYGLSQGDLVAYLLDPQKATTLFDTRNTITNLEKAYTSAQVGGAATRQGFTAGSQALSEEIVQQGRQDQAEAAFRAAALQEKDYARLGGLQGVKTGGEELVRESLALEGGTAVAKKKKTLESRERAQFSQKGAVGQTSLRKNVSL